MRKRRRKTFCFSSSQSSSRVLVYSVTSREICLAICSDLDPFYSVCREQADFLKNPNSVTATVAINITIIQTTLVALIFIK